MARQSPSPKPAPADTANTDNELVVDKEAVEQQRRADLDSVFAAQSAAGRERRLQKAARKDPAAQALLDERDTLIAERATLKARVAELEQQLSPKPPA